MASPLLALTRISKCYGPVQALSAVDLEVRAGEVVALVGDNGAGKSTLVKVIAGVDPADSGQIYWQGQHVTIRTPRDATALGVATVYQDLSLCPNLDVVANLFLGHEVVRFGILDETGMERRAQQLLSELAVTLSNPRGEISTLSGGQRQSVAIARVMLGAPKLVMLDEPTAALSVGHTWEVLEMIRKLSHNHGLGVILVSHNLADVRRVADRIVVLRLGRKKAGFVTDEVTDHDIVSAITGASMDTISVMEE
ncbi:MAG TPA: ATP-binding cassette domain-containing protein [Pseudonocardiaceae bacterium]